MALYVKTITLLVGLPQCGKDTYKYYSYRTPQLTNPTEDQVNEFLKRNLGSCLIDDDNFCDPDIRESAIRYLNKRFPDAKIVLKMWQNNPDACIDAARSGGKATEELIAKIRDLSARYKLPGRTQGLAIGDY